MEQSLPAPVKLETPLPPNPEIRTPEGIKGRVKEWTEKGRSWLTKMWGKTEEAPQEVLEEIKVAPERENELVKKPESVTAVGNNQIELQTDLQTEGRQRLEIPGLPEKYKVEDFVEDPKPLLTNDFRFLIGGNRWELSCRENQDRLYIDIKPKRTEVVTENNGVFVDTSLAQFTNDGKIELKPDSGYTTNLPLGYQEGMIHRGVYAGEMKDILEGGKIKTRGDAVRNIGGHQGLTFFTDLPDLAEGYAVKAGRVQGAYYPSFDQPNYIVSVKRPEQIAFEGSSGEVGISQDIPLSEIVSIVEVRPYTISQGVIPLESNTDSVRPAQGMEAYQNPLQMEVAYRIIPADRLKSELLAKQA